VEKPLISFHLLDWTGEKMTDGHSRILEDDRRSCMAIIARTSIFKEDSARLGGEVTDVNIEGR